MKSVTKRIYLIDFSLAILAYILFVIFDTFNKKLTGTYHVSQIVFVNSISALLPILLFTQMRNGWIKLKKAHISIHFFRTIFIFLAMLAFDQRVDMFTLLLDLFKSFESCFVKLLRLLGVIAKSECDETTRPSRKSC